MAYKACHHAMCLGLLYCLEHASIDFGAAGDPILTEAADKPWYIFVRRRDSSAEHCCFEEIVAANDGTASVYSGKGMWKYARAGVPGGSRCRTETDHP